MPTLVFISDTHGKHREIKHMPKGDILVHSGDWMSLEHDIHGVIDFLRWFEEQPYAARVFIAGNHDLIAERIPEVFQSLVQQYAPTCTYLEDQAARIQGINFYGSPQTPAFFNWAFNRQRGEEIKQYWDRIPNNTDVLVTHGPAHGFGDWSIYDRIHAGDDDLLEALHRVKPKIHACGHFHSGNGVKELVHGDELKTTMINASVVDKRYVVKNAPIIFIYPSVSQ